MSSLQDTFPFRSPDMCSHQLALILSEKCFEQRVFGPQLFSPYFFSVLASGLYLKRGSGITKPEHLCLDVAKIFG